jgi:NAD(P)H dehydrogenase (quinone)
MAARFTGRPVDFVIVTEEQLRASLAQAGIPADLAKAIVSIPSDYLTGDYAARTLEDVLSALSPI